MIAAHTPGSWLVHFSPNCWTVVQDGSSGRWQVAGGTAWGQPALAEQAKANGRLVAAAPELLEALQGLCEVGVPGAHRWEAARAAIAKATGDAA